jgi:putative transposase
VTRLAAMIYIRYPLSLRQVEDLLFERGVDICHETVRFWWNRFGPMLPRKSKSGVFIIDRIRAGAGTSTRCL